MKTYASPLTFPQPLWENLREHHFIYQEVIAQSHHLLGTDLCLLLMRSSGGMLLPLPASHLPVSLVPRQIAEQTLFSLVQQHGELIPGPEWQKASGMEVPGPVLVLPLLFRQWQPGYILFFLPDQAERPSKQILEPLMSLSVSLLALHILRQELVRRTEDLSLLLHAATAIGSQLGLDQTFQQILDSLTEVAGVANAAILIMGESGDHLILRAHRGYSAKVYGLRIPLDRGVTGRAARTAIVQLVQDVNTDPDYIRGVPDAKSEMALPLKAEGRVIGVLDLETTISGFFDENRQALIQSLADQVSLALYNSMLYERTQELAITDSLTGLFNRRTMYQQMEREIQRSRRFLHPLSLMMIDLDDFKRYNDEHGHLAGDEGLVRIAALIKSNVRDVDLSYRFGGEEFIVLVPETALEGAIRFAERLRQLIREALSFTVSIGVAQYAPNETAEAWLARVDWALYQAKKEGKDRVRWWTNDLPTGTGTHSEPTG